MKMSVKNWIWGTGRVTKEDVVLCGYKVPKGTYIVMVYKPSYTSEEHFQQAKLSIPVRWLKNSEECLMSKKVHPFTFFPFGFSSKLCRQTNRRDENRGLDHKTHP